MENEGLEPLLFVREDGEPLPKEGYEVINSLLHFSLNKPVKTEYNPKAKGIVVYYENPDEIIEVFNNHGYIKVSSKTDKL